MLVAVIARERALVDPALLFARARPVGRRRAIETIDARPPVADVRRGAPPAPRALSRVRFVGRSKGRRGAGCGRERALDARARSTCVCLAAGG